MASVVVRLVDGSPVVNDLEIEQVGFDGDDSLQAPARGGHGFHGVAFGDALRIELLVIRCDKTFKFFGRFIRKDHGLRAQSVACRISCGPGFAFGGDGASRLGAVESGGFGFEFRWHVGG